MWSWSVVVLTQTQLCFWFGNQSYRIQCHLSLSPKWTGRSTEIVARLARQLCRAGVSCLSLSCDMTFVVWDMPKCLPMFWHVCQLLTGYFMESHLSAVYICLSLCVLKLKHGWRKKSKHDLLESWNTRNFNIISHNTYHLPIFLVLYAESEDCRVSEVNAVIEWVHSHFEKSTFDHQLWVCHDSARCDPVEEEDRVVAVPWDFGMVLSHIAGWKVESLELCSKAIQGEANAQVAPAPEAHLAPF